MANELTLNWAYGFSKDKINGVVSLCAQERNALFLLSSHSGVLYDFEHRSQTILQGHCNIISCCAVDRNKRWIVTADAGIDPILVVWDASSFVPVKTFSAPHDGGIEALDISSDALYIATLSFKETSSDLHQEIAIWAWTSESGDAILRKALEVEDYHHSIYFDPSDVSQVVTTGVSSVLYWRWDNFNLDHYSGKVSKTDLGNYGGELVSTIFLPSTENAVTATSEGYVIVWETNSSFKGGSDEVNASMKEATKVLKLVDCGINILTTTANEYLVMACADGAVRFYDFFLRLEAWFEDLNAGPVTSISFSIQDCPYAFGEGGAPGLKFWVPDFIVGTSEGFVVGVESAIFDEVRRDDRRGTLLMQGMSDEVTAVACHPSLPLVAIACGNGVLQVWNYDMKLLMILREFNLPPAGGGRSDERKHSVTKLRNQLRPTCIAFDSTGSLLAAGFSSGVIKLLHTDSLEDISSYAPTSECIEQLAFSSSGEYLAGYDRSRHVLLFRRNDPDGMGPEDMEQDARNLTAGSSHRDSSEHGAQQKHNAYIYIGRALSHTAAITGIAFGMKEGAETLVSVSEDQFALEYDLSASSVSRGVICAKNSSDQTSSSCRLEMANKPTAVMWCPHLGEEEVEDRFVTATDAFKFKEFNVQSKQCRKTSLAPRFGSPVNKLVPVPRVSASTASSQQQRTEQLSSDKQPLTGSSGSRASNMFAFATPYRVIGLSSFPLTGDPSQTMGIVAHPAEVTSVAVSFDGKYLFSAGGSDLSANMWRIDLAPEVAGVQEAAGGEGVEMSPYFSLLDGGEGGDLHRDIVDYFYYCQLRHLGEDSMEPRNLSGRIPLEEIPSLFRSVGYYPSEDDVANILNEVRYKSFMITGETQDYIELNELIRLYINHRPALPLDKQLITSSFLAICRRMSEEPSRIDWESLLYCLTTEGEKISGDDLDRFLVALTGNDTKAIADSDSYDAKLFAEQILGFEDF